MKAYDRMIKIFKKFDMDRIKEIGRIEKRDFTRERKMPFKDILRYIISQKGKTIAMEINNYYKEINKRDERVTKQAFCKQRCRLNPEVFKVLGREYVESFYEGGEYKTYKGYIVTAVDGTILEIPNSKELQKEYECQSPTDNNKRKSARAKASGIYDVENNIMIDAIIEKYNTPERQLAKKNLEAMIKIIGTDKKIISIFDRGYMSVDMLFHLANMPIYYLFRVQKDKCIEEKKSMKSDDEVVDIKISKKRLENILDEDMKIKAKQTDKIKARMVRIVLSTSEEEYLITNIPYDEMDTKEIGELYFKRWGIETAYDVIKNKLCIENISGRKKVIVEQDFYAQIMLFNMVEDLKNDANKELEQKKDRQHKYEYKVNINILIGTFREYLIKIAIEEDSVKRKQLYEYMLEEIMENLVPIRTGRSFPRIHYKGRNKNKVNMRRNS